MLVVRLAAPPVDGAANDALIDSSPSALDVPRRAVHIVSGERRTPRKRITIEGVRATAQIPVVADFLIHNTSEVLTCAGPAPRLGRDQRDARPHRRSGDRRAPRRDRVRRRLREPARP